MVVALSVAVVACDVSDPAYVGDGGGARVAVIGDALTFLAADEVRAEVALTDEVRIGATAGIGVGESLARAAELAATAPDVVVVELGMSEARDPQDFDGTAGGAEDPFARAAMIDRTAGDLAALFSTVGGACTVGVTVSDVGAPPTFDGAVADRVNEVVRGTADVVVDLDAALGPGAASVVLDGSAQLTAEGAALYAEIVADAVRECREGPDGPLTVRTSLKTARDALRVNWEVDRWSVEGIRALAGGPTAADYRVELVDSPSPGPWQNSGTSPFLELPLSSARHAIRLEVGLRVTIEYGDGGESGPLDGAFWFPAHYDIPESTEWSASQPEVVVDEATRQAKRLVTWADGNIGFAEIGGQQYGFASNGAGYARWTMTDTRFVAQVENRSTMIGGLPPDVDYASGGPVYVDPSSGDVLMWYHGEKYPDGDPTRFWAFIGMAVSHDGGATFSDLGPIITPELDMASPNRSWATEVGGAPYAIVNGWFYVYYRETTAAGEARGMSVARARVSTVVSAAHNGNATAWTKRQGSWSAPGIGGQGQDLFGDAPAPRWFDVVHLVDRGQYLMVASDGHGGDWTYMVRTSSDGLTWSPPTRLDIPTGGDEALYLSLSSPDRTSQREVRGDVVHLYRPTTELRGWSRWGGEATHERIALTHTGG